jgi:hypothetical protein
VCTYDGYKERNNALDDTRAHARENGGSNMAPKDDGITLDAWNACARQADMARLLGREGKSFRDVTRRVFGQYVAHGDTLDARLRGALYAYHVTHAGNADARIELVRAYKAGEDIA